MIKVGDIVEWANRDIDEIRSFGIVEKVRQSFNHFFITVRCFDNGMVDDYLLHDLKLIQTV